MLELGITENLRGKHPVRSHSSISTSGRIGSIDKKQVQTSMATGWDEQKATNIIGKNMLRWSR